MSGECREVLMRWCGDGLLNNGASWCLGFLGVLLPSFLARGSRAGPSVRGRAAHSAAGRRPLEASLDGLSLDLPVAREEGVPGGKPGSRLPHLELTI